MEDNTIKLSQNEFDRKEQAIFERIKLHYGTKLERVIGDEEAKEIAGNLLLFAKSIYGSS